MCRDHYPVAVAELSLLRDVPLLTELTDAEMAQVEAATTTTDLLRGDLLFAEDETPTDLHVVVSGRIAISKRSVDGRESMVALMERGDLFGEMGLFDGLGRSAEARALEVSQVLTIPYTPLQAIYESRPALLWSVVKLLAGRLRNTDTALADSVFLDVTGRTAKRLLELAGDDDEFILPITQEELAGMVGASRERVNKAIASFVRLGWIDQRERRYRILNRVELDRRAR
jgi:CRP-like cAMP-binding protein